MLYANGTSIIKSEHPIFLLGCNVRGMAYNPAVDGRYDDWYTYRYQDARHIRALGFNTVRLVVYWECLEISESPNEFSFNNSYIDLIRQTVEAYNKEGIYVILNLHEHGSVDELKRFIPTLSSDTDFADTFYSDTSNTSAREHIKSLWLRMSETFKNHTGVAGYDILEEPHHSSGSLSDQQVSDLWFDISDYVISALRAEGDNHIVFIEFCPAARSTDYMSRKLNDSNVVCEPHFYYGINTSDLSVLNNDYSWLNEQFAANVNDKMLDFGVPFIMGEQGFGGNQLTNDQSIWLENAIAISKSNPLMQG
jgi:aryl-phospho-beta-D-glucosidase BglC (GH1 family)